MKTVMRRSMLFFMALMAILCLFSLLPARPVEAAAVNKVFYSLSTSPFTMYQANGGATLTGASAFTPGARVYTSAIDSTNKKIYWPDEGADKIYWQSLDNTGALTGSSAEFATLAAGDTVRGMSVYNGKLFYSINNDFYWQDTVLGTKNLIYTGDATHKVISSSVDFANGRLYYVLQNGINSSMIYGTTSADPKGPGTGAHALLAANTQNPVVDIDAYNGILYFIFDGEEESIFIDFSYYLVRAPSDGVSVINVGSFEMMCFSSIAVNTYFLNVAVAPWENQIYFNEGVKPVRASGKIFRLALDIAASPTRETNGLTACSTAVVDTLEVYSADFVNTAPTFVGAITALTVVQNSSNNDIKDLLHASDTDSGQTLTWSQNTGPGHGSLSFSGATAATGLADITPGGTITYTPTPGYTGADSFIVQVSDGTATATRTISVTVTGIPAMAISSSGGAIADGSTGHSVSDNTDFGNTPVTGGSVLYTYTITNSGSATLTLSGSSPYVTITGDTGDFTLSGAAPSSSIAASGGTTTFTIKFDPTATGVRSATISISSNDSNSPYTFEVQGTGQAPEMDVQGNGNSIADGDLNPSATDDTIFGNADILTGSHEHTFTIYNTGNLVLNLSGDPIVAVSGNTSDFSVTAQPSASTVSASGSITFKVTFNPTAVGITTADISIANDDADENPYNFRIQGTGIAAPEIAISGGGQLISNNDLSPAVADGTNFGDVNVISGSVEHTFTITNSGSAQLTLTGAPLVLLSNTTDFSVTLEPVSPVDPAGGTTTFKITFDPQSAGARTSTVTIVNNDSDEGTYVFGVEGIGLAPEINLKQGVTSYASGGAGYDYGSHKYGTNTDITFTVENTGDAALTITLPLVLGGAGGAQFSIESSPDAVIGAASSSTFTIRFAPTSAGVKNASITINNDDSNEGTYVLNLTGTGTVPEIQVEGNSTIIDSGDVTPSTADDTDFGHTNITGGTVVKTFTIRNTGTASLVLTDAAHDYVTVNNADFTVTAVPSTPIAAAGTTTFQITFDPSAVGLSTAIVSIANDDSDENPYTFTIQGLGTTAPVISNLAGNAVNFTEGGTPVFIDSGTAAAVTDDGSSSYDGGWIHFDFTGATANDYLGIDGTHVQSDGSGTVAVGDTISVDGTDIGIVLADGLAGNNLRFSLNADATDSLLTTLVQNITYHNTSQDPATPRPVVVSVRDIYDTSATYTVSITVTGVNDPPTLTATGVDPTFTEGGVAADLYSAVTAGTVEAGQTITQVVFTVTNVSNGTNEILVVDGSDVTLTDGTTVDPTVTNGMTVTVGVTGTTATVTVGKTGGISAALMQTLIDAMTYRNTSDNPLGANRVVTITSIKDNGGTANSGVDTTSLSLVSTVTITPVNDPPVVANITGDSVDVVAGDGATLIDEHDDATVSDVDSLDFDGGGLGIVQTGGTTNGNFGAEGTNFTSGGDAVIAAGETISIGGTDIGTVQAGNDGQNGHNLMILLNSNATPARVQTMIRNITYSAPTALGARTFTLTVTDGDGGSALANFTVNVTPNPPVITNLNGDTFTYDPIAGGLMRIDVGVNAAVTDADSANFNGGNLTVVISDNLTPAEDILGITENASVALSTGTSIGSTVTIGGVTIGTVSDNGTDGNNLVVTFNAGATPARVSTILRALSYANTDNATPSLATRTIQVTITDAGASSATSLISSVTVNIGWPEIEVRQGATVIVSGGNYDFGNKTVNTDTDIVITVNNLGGAGLSLTVPLTIGGVNADQFSLQSQPAANIAAGANSVFTVRFHPTAAAAATANITIANNDLDEGAYVLILQGAGTAAGGGGGGGGGPPAQTDDTIYVTGSEVSLDTNSGGQIQHTYVFTSEDENVDIVLPKGTSAKDVQGNAIEDITIVVDADAPAPPSGNDVIGPVYNLGPSGAVFNPPITITFTYTHDQIPPGVEEGNLEVAFYDEVTGTWLSLTGVVDTETNTITITTTHFTDYAIVGKVTMFPVFTVSGLSIKPATVEPGAPVEVSVTVKNNGTLAGTYHVSLKLNGVVKNTADVILDIGGSKVVMFRLPGQPGGTYTVEVNGLTGSLVVNDELIIVPTTEPQKSKIPIVIPPTSSVSSPTPVVTTEPVRNTSLWWIWVAIAGVVILAVVLILRRRHD